MLKIQRIFIFSLSGLLFYACQSSSYLPSDFMEFEKNEYNISVLNLKKDEFYLIPQLVEFVLQEGVKCVIISNSVLIDSVSYTFQSDKVIFLDKIPETRSCKIEPSEYPLACSFDFKNPDNSYCIAAKAALLVRPEVSKHFSSFKEPIKISYFDGEGGHYIELEDVQDYLFSNDVMIITDYQSETSYYTPQWYYRSDIRESDKSKPHSPDMKSSVLLANMINTLVLLDPEKWKLD